LNVCSRVVVLIRVIPILEISIFIMRVLKNQRLFQLSWGNFSWWWLQPCRMFRINAFTNKSTLIWLICLIFLVRTRLNNDRILTSFLLRSRLLDINFVLNYFHSLFNLSLFKRLFLWFICFWLIRPIGFVGFCCCIFNQVLFKLLLFSL
jgi:hypothetical protein